MNKEQQELLDEAYENYFGNFYKLPNKFKWMKEVFYSDGNSIHHVYLREEFINKCKTNTEFSEKWGLKIEERELSWEERRDLLTPEQYDGTALNKYGRKDCGFGYISPFTDKVIHYWMNLHNIPTKLITIKYNDKTIESYE
jgi:hypothetical protein